MKTYLSRRQFLKTTVSAAGALGSPLILPVSVLGRGGAVSPNERVTLGVIGLGAQGTPDMEMFLHEDNVRVVALCDVNQRHLDRARKIVAEKYGRDEVRLYRDFRELNAQNDIDAVLIALPVHWHTIPALNAAANRKHMYLEKPIALSLNEGKLLRAAVKKNKVVFQFGTQQRSDVNFRWASELALNGRLGKLKHIEVGVPGGIETDVFPTEPVPDWLDWDRWVGPAPMAPFNMKRLQREFHENITDYSLGMISCWGIHHLDIAQWGNGTEQTGPLTVEGTGVFPKSGTCNAILSWEVRYTYADAAEIRFATDKQYKHGIRFVGENGWVHVDRSAITAENRALLADPQNKCGAMPIKLPVSVHHQRDLIEAIRTGRPTVAGVDSAVRSDTLCHLGLAAVTLGRKLRWDPGTETYVDDRDANKMLEPRGHRAPWRLPT
jgi:predicted dehydrogenase